MPRVRLGAFGVFAALAAHSLGCAFETPPSTLEIADVEPREVDVGERLEISGRGFPIGRVAHVTFRGEARRPGQEPVKVRVDVDANAESAERLELPVGDALGGPLCGHGDAAVHATFRGEIAVAFDPAQTGSAPLLGRAGQVVLDVRPDSTSPLARRRAEDEGRKTLAFLGVRVGARAPTAGGVTIEAVDPGSRAEGAGLHAGDVIAELDGVRVGSLDDLVPVGGDAATMVVRSALGADERTLRVPIEGLKTRIGRDVVRAGVVVGGALALLWLLLRPSSGAVAWLERRIAARLRARAIPRDRAGVRGTVERLLSSIERIETGGPKVAERLGVAALATIAFVALPLLEAFGGFDLDVMTPYLIALSTTLGLAFAGARDGEGRFQLRAAMATSARALAFEVPGAIAVACAIVVSGSLRLSDVSRGQGGWPWEWAAFRSPAMLAAFVVALAMAVPARARAKVAMPEQEPGLADGDARGLVLRGVDEASRFGFAAMATALFCGGWELPGLAAVDRDAWWGLQLLGAAVFVAKAWALAFAVGALRRTLPRLHGASLARVLARFVAPTIALAVLATAGWVAWHPSHGASIAVQLATFGLALAALGAIAARVFHGATTITTRHVDPRV